jgi:hypothetical protein
MGGRGQERNLAIVFEAPQSGHVCRHASAHLFGHRAEYLHGFDAARDQRGQSAQGALFGDEPAIFDAELRADDALVGSPACRFFGDREFIKGLADGSQHPARIDG